MVGVLAAAAAAAAVIFQEQGHQPAAALLTLDGGLVMVVVFQQTEAEYESLPQKELWQDRQQELELPLQWYPQKRLRETMMTT